MEAVRSFVTERSNLFAPLGALTASYIAFSFLRSVWNGLKVYVLSPALGLSANLKRFGEWAVVTGATDGIGKGYAYELARKGINIFLISRSPEKLSDVAKEIENKFSVKTKTLAVDFSGKDSIYEKIQKELQGMDIGVLVNNVGMSYVHPEYYAELQDEIVEKLLHVNVHSVAMMTKIVLPIMTEKKKGVIINIASAAATHAVALLSLYSATKAFVDHFTAALRQEYASRGIIMQCVLPYFVATKLSRIRHSSFFAPDPFSYARSAVATVGVEQRTYGCISHALQAYVISLLPSWIVEKIGRMQMAAVRKAAIKRAEKKK